MRSSLIQASYIIASVLFILGMRGLTRPDKARRGMQAAAVYSQDSLSGPANIIGTALAIGRSLDDVAAWPDKIGAVTAAEVQAAAQAVLVERNSATGILLPERTS